MFSKKSLFVILCILLSFSFLTADVTAEEFEIGINNFGQANFFAVQGREYMIERVEEKGGVAIDTVTADVPGRMDAIEDYITRDVDAIIVQEGDISQVGPAIEEAQQAGIKVISMDAGHHPAVDVVVESNNWVLGARAASELMYRIGGEGNIVEIYNDLGQMIRMRREMLHGVLSEYPDVEIAAGFVYDWPDFYPDVLDKMESVLEANPEPGDIDGVFATFDGAGIAASEAIREAGLADYITVVGIDGDPEAYDEMRREDTPFEATIAHDVQKIAYTAVDKAFKLLEGEEIDRDHVYVPGELVTREDLIE